MNSKFQLKINIRMIPLSILLITACLKWFIEGIMDMAFIEVILLSVGLAITALKHGVTINRNAFPWLLYIFNILFSLLIHESGFGLWGRGIVTILITAYVFLVDSEIKKYQNIMKLLVNLGIITGVVVIIHYLLGSSFNNFYFPFLRVTARKMAELYTRYGYYFGFLYNPHEPAGLITFAIAGILIWKLIHKKKTIICYIAAILLVIPLLLTGKKAVLICMFLALMITILMLYGSRRQWIRVIRFILLIFILTITFFVVVINNPDLEIFKRFNQFFEELFIDGAIDSGRMILYQHAFSEWQDNFFIGIGWRHFNALTTSKFGISQSHEVNCDYLQWLCETGIIGFVMSVVPIFIMVYRTVYVIRKIIKNNNSNNEAWILLLAAFIQIFTVIYAVVEIPFFDIIYFSVYILTCVIINSAYRRRKFFYE